MLSLTFTGCSDAAGIKRVSSNAERKGDKYEMKTYYIGRFAIDVPQEFKLEIQKQKIRYAEVSDFKWDKSKELTLRRKEKWAEKISTIRNLPQPVNKQQIIIEERDFHGIGKWARGVIYRGDYLIPRRLFWTVLVDYGDVGVWLTIAGTNNNLMLKNFSNILSSYQVGANQSPQHGFCLKYGSISLPYLEQEKSYARFEGPMGISLKVEMNEIHKEPEKEGIIDRTVAAMATGFASGLDIKKIRSRKRTVAGLPGEEEILEGDDGRKKNVSFDWEYAGKVESGEHPMILISIDTQNDALEDKIGIWDRILESFRRAY